MKIPGLSKWNMYAGGSGAAEGKHSYDFYTKPIKEGGAQFSISPISSQRGRHLGYRLTAFGLPGYSGHVWISPKGELDQIGKAALFSRAASAAKVAGEVYKRIGKENPPGKKTPDIKVGDLVKYSRDFLRSTGMFTGAIPHATGKVTGLVPLSPETILAEIDWGREDIPKRVNTKNLVLKSRLHLESNPPRRIAITYETISPESAKEGDVEDHGWETSEEGDAVGSIQEAIDYILDRGGVEPSSTVFHSGVWYSTVDPDSDYMTGEDKFYSFHLRGFKPSEEKVIFSRIVGKRARFNPPTKTKTKTKTKNIGDESGQSGGVHVDIYSVNPSRQDTIAGLLKEVEKAIIDKNFLLALSKLRELLVLNETLENPTGERFMRKPGKLGEAIALVNRWIENYHLSKPHIVTLRHLRNLLVSHAAGMETPGKMNPPRTEIYRNIIEIRAKKKDGKLYRHPFGPGAAIYGNPDGSLLIKSAKGKRLWKNFQKGKR